MEYQYYCIIFAETLLMYNDHMLFVFIFYFTGDDIEELPAEEETLKEQTPSTSKSYDSFIPASKKQKKQSFEELIDIERDNALIKRENLLLKQEKLKLEIELLKCKVRQSTLHNEDGVFFSL